MCWRHLKKRTFPFIGKTQLLLTKSRSAGRGHMKRRKKRPGRAPSMPPRKRGSLLRGLMRKKGKALCGRKEGKKKTSLPTWSQKASPFPRILEKERKKGPHLTPHWGAKERGLRRCFREEGKRVNRHVAAPEGEVQLSVCLF